MTFDERVNVAARALFEHVHPFGSPSWAAWCEIYGDNSKYHKHARSALTAAGVPELLAELNDWQMRAMAPDESSALIDENRTLRAEVERLRAVLGSCGGFLAGCRDDYSLSEWADSQAHRLCLDIHDILCQHCLSPEEAQGNHALDGDGAP